MRLGKYAIPSRSDSGGEVGPVGDCPCEPLYGNRQVWRDAGLAEQRGQLFEVDCEGISRRRPACEQIVASLAFFRLRVAQVQPAGELPAELESSSQRLAQPP